MECARLVLASAVTYASLTLLGFVPGALGAPVTSTGGGADVVMHLFALSPTPASHVFINTPGTVNDLQTHTTFVVDNNVVRAVTFTGEGSAQGVTSASFGSLNGVVNLFTRATPTAHIFTNSDGTTGSLSNPFLISSRAGANATFTDTLSITSSTLPVGTVVMLQASVGLDVGYSVGMGCCFGNVSAGAFAEMRFLELFQGREHSRTGTNLPVFDVGSTFNGMPTNTPPSLSRTLDIPVRVGATLDIEGLFGIFGTINGGASACGGFPCPGAPFGILEQVEFSVDAQNTALFNIDVLDSRVSFTSASGHNYATLQVPPPPGGVPEPTTLALLGLGLAGLGLGRFHRGRGRRHH